MANVKQIKINDTVYDVEDSVARSALEQKAPLESPALTGIPTAPTASNGTSTTQVATTAFVQNAVQGAGGSYTLPVASSTTLGGVKPVTKTSSMTQEVGVDASGALYTEPGSGGGGTVTSVNGATGEVKSTFYVTITSAEDESISADKTLEEIYTAYEKGYAVYAKTATSPQIIVPLTIAVHSGNDYAVVFNGAVTFGDTTEYAISNDGSGWTIYAKDIAFKDNIPTIPTELKNPYSLNIKIGDTTTSYDGSAEKTVEIPKGVPAVTASDNGKFLRVVNGAWAAEAIDNANGGSF